MLSIVLCLLTSSTIAGHEVRRPPTPPMASIIYTSRDLGLDHCWLRVLTLDLLGCS